MYAQNRFSRFFALSCRREGKTERVEGFFCPLKRDFRLREGKPNFLPSRQIWQIYSNWARLRTRQLSIRKRFVSTNILEMIYIEILNLWWWNYWLGAEIWILTTQWYLKLEGKEERWRKDCTLQAFKRCLSVPPNFFVGWSRSVRKCWI